MTVKHFLMAVMASLFIWGISPGYAGEVHFNGYGELHYSNSLETGGADKIDQHRLVLGWGYDFSENISLHAEIDYEHAATEMELELAYLDWRMKPWLNLRAGALLMPVGYLNEFHEPPLFYSVERPYVQKNIIPSTWQEGGAGLFGTVAEKFNYRVYLVNGLQAVNFKASSGIRSGRSKVAEAPANDLAVVGRLEGQLLKGLNLGFSGYRGNAAQAVDTIGNVGVTLLEGDIRYRRSGVELTGLYARILLTDTDLLSASTGQSLGKVMQGWYGEAAYHVGALFLPEPQDLVVMIRMEAYNTQHEMAAGLTADKANDKQVLTAGLTYFPLASVAFKLDFENWKDGNDDTRQQLNAGVAYMY